MIDTSIYSITELENDQLKKIRDELRPLLTVVQPINGDISLDDYNKLVAETETRILELQESRVLSIMLYSIRTRMLRARRFIRIQEKLIKYEINRRDNKKVSSADGDALSVLSSNARNIVKNLRITMLRLKFDLYTEDLVLFKATKLTDEAEHFSNSLLCELTRIASRTKAAQVATDSRYKSQRLLLKQAACVARSEWQNGSTLLHHQMKKFLVEEFQDESGKHPFLHLQEKSILKVVKQVAKEMNRTDLISGQKKRS